VKEPTILKGILGCWWWVGKGHGEPGDEDAISVSPPTPVVGEATGSGGVRNSSFVPDVRGLAPCKHVVGILAVGAMGSYPWDRARNIPLADAGRMI